MFSYQLYCLSQRNNILLKPQQQDKRNISFPNQTCCANCSKPRQMWHPGDCYCKLRHMLLLCSM